MKAFQGIFAATHLMNSFGSDKEEEDPVTPFWIPQRKFAKQSKRKQSKAEKERDRDRERDAQGSSIKQKATKAFLGRGTRSLQ